MISIPTQQRFSVFAAGASASYRDASKNQDAVRPGGVHGGQGAYAVVCDGVGAQPESGPVARDVATMLADQLTDFGVLHPARWLSEVAERYARRDADEPRDGSTTAVVVGADSHGERRYALAGNGCVLNVEGIPLNGSYRIQWASLALPHITYASGPPALRSFIPMSSAQPDVTSGSLDPPMGMSLLIAGSDGFMSEEERRVGRSGGERWVQTPKPVVAVEELLTTIWGDLLTVPEPGELLSVELQAVLDGLAADNVLDDDTTVGAVIVRPAGTAG